MGLTGPTDTMVMTLCPVRDAGRPALFRHMNDPEKCGSTVTGHDRGFAHARGKETDEPVLTLGQ